MRESIHLALWSVDAIMGNNQVYSHKVGRWEKAEDNISGGWGGEEGYEEKDMRWFWKDHTLRWCRSGWLQHEGLASSKIWRHELCSLLGRSEGQWLGNSLREQKGHKPTFKSRGMSRTKENMVNTWEPHKETAPSKVHQVLVTARREWECSEGLLVLGECREVGKHERWG